MLLTSAGIRNETLKSALAGLVGKPLAAAKLVVIPTATMADASDHGWFVANLTELHGFGWRGFQLVELNGLPAQTVLDRMRSADVIYVEGGNVYHLANSIIANGLAAEMAAMLESKVYVGASAGSMVFSRHLSNRTGEAFEEHEKLRILGETAARPPFGLFDWHIKPHLNSLHFPGRNPAWFKQAAARVDFPVFVLDDDSAVRVRGDKVDVVSAGEWRLLNAREPVAQATRQEFGRAPGLAEGIPQHVYSWRNRLIGVAAAGSARARRAYGNAFRGGW